MVLVHVLCDPGITRKPGKRLLTYFSVDLLVKYLYLHIYRYICIKTCLPSSTLQILMGRKYLCTNCLYGPWNASCQLQFPYLLASGLWHWGIVYIHCLHTYVDDNHHHSKGILWMSDDNIMDKKAIKYTQTHWCLLWSLGWSEGNHALHHTPVPLIQQQRALLAR